jgi:hypothetical protein
MADPGQKYLDLSFIERDVRNQLVHSRDIISQVELLRAVASRIEDPATKAQIEDSIRRLLSIANSVSANALSTSASTATIIGPMFEPGKK